MLNMNWKYKENLNFDFVSFLKKRKSAEKGRFHTYNNVIFGKSSPTTTEKMDSLWIHWKVSQLHLLLNVC